MYILLLVTLHLVINEYGGAVTMLPVAIRRSRGAPTDGTHLPLPLPIRTRRRGGMVLHRQVGLDATTIVGVLSRLSKRPLPKSLADWIERNCAAVGRAKVSTASQCRPASFHCLTAILPSCCNFLGSETLRRNCSSCCSRTATGSNLRTGMPLLCSARVSSWLAGF